jgi:hypothetical protein
LNEKSPGVMPAMRALGVSARRARIAPYALTYVTGFDRVQPAELSEEDARLDGCASRDALIAELRALYGDHLDSVPCFRIRFTYEGPPPQEAPGSPAT